MRAFIIFLAIVLGSCTIVPVPKVEDRNPAQVPDDSRPSPIALNTVRTNIPRGTTVGALNPSIFCKAPWGKLTSREITKHLDNAEMRDAFDNAMETQGYDVTGRSDILFDEEDDIARTLYSIGAQITDIKIGLCDKSHVGILFFSNSMKGEGYIKVDWTVYDRLRRKTVYRTTTEGYTDLKLARSEALGLILDDAFAAAAHNLGADKNFRDLIVLGKKPAGKPKNAAPEPDAATGTPDPVELPVKPLSTTPLRKTMEQGRKVAVLIESGAGHGSGFFISENGHILTNQHVVGNAEKVRVVTADKKKKLIGTVLRRDKVRDVALVKLDEPLENIVTLPIRTNWPAVGEDVYAIGAPIYSKTLQDTVTKGIVSAHRKHMKTFGAYMDLIQADVTIHGGNSGGPLLDMNGNIVGLCVASYNDRAGDSASGLNLFIPIEIALKKLNIEY